MTTSPNTPNTSDASTLRTDGDGYWYLIDAAGNGEGENYPRIMECEDDWKVSPFGDADPDRDCYWVDTAEEAEAELRELRTID